MDWETNPKEYFIEHLAMPHSKEKLANILPVMRWIGSQSNSGENKLLMEILDLPEFNQILDYWATKEPLEEIHKWKKEIDNDEK